MQKFKQKVQEIWKAVLGLAIPIALGALSTLIDQVGDYLQLNFGTSVWIGVATGVLVWFKKNLPAN